MIENRVSVIEALENLHTALVNLSEAWDYNTEYVDLNELNSIRNYPFEKDLMSVTLETFNWIYETKNEINEMPTLPLSDVFKKAWLQLLHEWNYENEFAESDPTDELAKTRERLAWERMEQLQSLAIHMGVKF